MKTIYLHKLFNPHLKTIQEVIDEVEDKEYRLFSVYAISEFQWVVIFIKEVQSE